MLAVEFSKYIIVMSSGRAGDVFLELIPHLVYASSGCV